MEAGQERQAALGDAATVNARPGALKRKEMASRKAETASTVDAGVTGDNYPVFTVDVDVSDQAGQAGHPDSTWMLNIA